MRVPILLVSTPKTKAACKEIQDVMEKLVPGFVTMVEGEGEAPYSSAAVEIDKWLRVQTRPLFPTEVRLTPNHDRFHSAHWVEIGACVRNS